MLCCRRTPPSFRTLPPPSNVKTWQNLFFEIFSSYILEPFFLFLVFPLKLFAAPKGFLSPSPLMVTARVFFFTDYSPDAWPFQLFPPWVSVQSTLALGRFFCPHVFFLLVFPPPSFGPSTPNSLKTKPVSYIRGIHSCANVVQLRCVLMPPPNPPLHER